MSMQNRVLSYNEQVVSTAAAGRTDYGVTDMTLQRLDG